MISSRRLRHWGGGRSGALERLCCHLTSSRRRPYRTRKGPTIGRETLRTSTSLELLPSALRPPHPYTGSRMAEWVSRSLSEPVNHGDGVPIGSYGMHADAPDAGGRKQCG